MRSLSLIVLMLFGTPFTQAAEESAFGTGSGVTGEVLALAVQPDGKILLGGRFSAVNGVPRSSIARLNKDGTLDRTFADQPPLGVNGQVNAIALQSDGGIVVGGQFAQAGQTEVLNLARYNADGSIDKSFGGHEAEAGTNGVVFALSVTPDGKIVVGGNFNTVFGQQRRSLAVLKPDGTPEGPAVSKNELSGSVRAVAFSDTAPVAGGVFKVTGQNAVNLVKIPD